MQLPLPTSLQRSVSAAITVAACLIAFLIVNALVNFSNVRTLTELRKQDARAYGILKASAELLSTAQDAETGQRGFLITGDKNYLKPYESAVARKAEQLSAFARCVGSILRIIFDF
ncbi:MAG: CHASE3 domain-containing protein [Pirellulales bacterium]